MKRCRILAIMLAFLAFARFSHAQEGFFFPSMRRRCDVNRSFWVWASIVCLRFLAERFSAGGQGFSHRSSGASRRGTLTGSLPVRYRFPQNEGM